MRVPRSTSAEASAADGPTIVGPGPVALPAAVVVTAAAGVSGFVLNVIGDRLGWEFPSPGRTALLAAWGASTLGVLRYAVHGHDEAVSVASAVGLHRGHGPRELARRAPAALAGLAAAGLISVVVNHLPFGQSLSDPAAFGAARSVAVAVLLGELLVRYPITVFAEEALFRGWLQPRLPAGVLLSAVLWAGFHLQQVPTIPALVPYGIALGTLRWWTGNIYAALAVHYTGNALFLLSTYG